ncbi:hypothetical protein B4R02_26840 [Salmonella enterica]|nr:hypothetical protein [Salmonella enterica subsp. diarizonae serovar 42:l,v:1,5,7]
MSSCYLSLKEFSLQETRGGSPDCINARAEHNAQRQPDNTIIIITTRPIPISDSIFNRTSILRGTRPSFRVCSRICSPVVLSREISSRNKIIRITTTE